MEQQSDLISKWSRTGLLRDVHPQYLQQAAERLERAARKSIGTCNHHDIDNEIVAMAREGIFKGRSVNSEPRRR